MNIVLLGQSLLSVPGAIEASMKLIRTIEKGIDFFEKTLNVVSMILISGIVLIIFYAVIMRYVFNHPPYWSEELSRFIFIWIIMIGAVLVTREQSHIELALFVNHLSRRWKFVFFFFARFLMLVFCWVMVHQGVKIYPIVAEATSPIFGISMGWLYLSIPVGGLFMGICILETLVKSLKRR